MTSRPRTRPRTRNAQVKQVFGYLKQSNKLIYLMRRKEGVKKIDFFNQTIKTVYEHLKSVKKLIFLHKGGGPKQLHFDAGDAIQRLTDAARIRAGKLYGEKHPKRSNIDYIEPLEPFNRYAILSALGVAGFPFLPRIKVSEPIEKTSLRSSDTGERGM